MHDLRRWLLSAVLFAFPFGSVIAGSSPALLDEMFQDHAVLQRDRPIPIWGQAEPNDEVTVEFNGASVTARADAQGQWKLELPATSAGGPFELAARASSGTTQTIADVLVGDVWLCSGQSNMEWPVKAALNSFAEIHRAPNDAIRLLTVSKHTSFTPLDTFHHPVSWQRATSESAAEFSAVCFFFARELQKHVPVPMGLIHSSWGGAKIEPWMSVRALESVGGYQDELEMLALRESDPLASIQRWSTVWESWWRSKVPNEQPWNANDKGEWTKAPQTLSHWEEWNVPELADFNGMLWFRAHVQLSAKQAKQDATLRIGRVDDVDMTWVNGRAIGSTAGPDTERAYRLPKGTLKPGSNTIVVNALDLWAGGGIWGPSESRTLELADGTSIALDGRWEYRIVPESVGRPPRTPWDETAGLALIGNAMIAPLGNYRMRGVLWYQGESNTESDNYEALLTHWIQDWRSRFGEDAALLIVQLANFGAASTQPTESGWANVREAQRRMVAKDKNAGLAVTIDLGDRYDIHPANKQQVGARLARAARHVIYGEKITPSGPTPLGARKQGDAVVVSFADVEGRLVAYSNDHPVGFELCGASQDSCRYARATIDGTTVRLTAPNAADATRVRFCWADSPICTLYDEAALPAGPFEVAIE